MNVIKTKRLRLISLNDTQLETLLNEGRSALNLQSGLAPSSMEVPAATMAEFNEVLPLWIDRAKKYPADYALNTTWDVVHESENVVIGNVGLGSSRKRPDLLTIGYMISEQFQNAGFATEAITGMIDWAFSNKKIKRIQADTPIENYSSQRVLEKNNFQVIKTERNIVYWELKRVR